MHTLASISPRGGANSGAAETDIIGGALGLFKRATADNRLPVEPQVDPA